MKDYYFHFTGEVRPPKKGEYCTSDYTKTPFMANFDFCPNGADYNIFTRHEIEVPVGSKCFQYDFIGQCGHRICDTKQIPLCKPKVKKWRWVIVDNNRKPHLVVELHSEEEAREYLSRYMVYHKIPETEIEVEE